MKTITTAVTVLTVVLGLAVANAGPTKESPAGKTKSTKVATTNSKAAEHTATKGELTGSRLKQTYRRNGQITDGAANVVVLDQAAIERSGASDLRALLARRGLGH